MCASWPSTRAWAQIIARRVSGKKLSRCSPCACTKAMCTPGVYWQPVDTTAAAHAARPDPVSFGHVLHALGVPSPGPTWAQVLRDLVRDGSIEPWLVEPSFSSASAATRLGINAAAPREPSDLRRAEPTLALLRALGVSDRGVADAVSAWLADRDREAFVGVVSDPAGADRAKLYF